MGSAGSETPTTARPRQQRPKRRRAKRGGESFSAVLRRARFVEATGETAGAVHEPSAGYGVTAGSAESSPDYWDRVEASERATVALESFDTASRRQQERNRAWVNRAGQGSVPAERGWTREDLYTERMPGK